MSNESVHTTVRYPAHLFRQVEEYVGGRYDPQLKSLSDWFKAAAREKIDRDLESSEKFKQASTSFLITQALEELSARQQTMSELRQLEKSDLSGKDKLSLFQRLESLLANIAFEVHFDEIRRIADRVAQR